jgi:hypothetical protein
MITVVKRQRAGGVAMVSEAEQAGKTSVLIWAIASAVLCVLLIIVGLQPQQVKMSAPPPSAATPATSGSQSQ